MIVEITPQQRDILVALIDEALDEVGPEIHHARSTRFKDWLKEEKKTLKALRDLFCEMPEAESTSI